MNRWFDLGRYLIVAGCLYEVVAIPHRTPVPTITCVVRGIQKHRHGKVMAVIWLGIWAHHFIDRNHYARRGRSTHGSNLQRP